MVFVSRGKDATEEAVEYALREGLLLFLVLAVSRFQNFLGLVARFSEMFCMKSLYLVDTRFLNLFLIVL